jgi:hypothetical protein
MQPAGQVPQVLAGMIEIDDPNRTGEVDVGQIPDPFGSIADDDFLLRMVPSSVPGFQIKALAELFGGLDGSGIGSRIRIAKPSLSWVV